MKKPITEKNLSDFVMSMKNMTENAADTAPTTPKNFHTLKELIDLMDECSTIQDLIAANEMSRARMKYRELVITFKEKGLELPQDLKNMDQLKDLDHPGALKCGIETFTAIYDLERARSERQGQPVCLVHLCLTGSGPAEKLQEASNKLEEVLENNLRKGDVVCRSDEQLFYLLLTNVDHERVPIVLDRIETTFNNLVDMEHIELSHRFLEI